MSEFKVAVTIGYYCTLERIRRVSFFVTLLVTVFTGLTFFPSKNSGFGAMEVEGYRGIYNSAWIGTVLSIVASLFLLLIGFYLIKNSIQKDKLLGVDEIIASTPVKNQTYIWGKFFSNLGILTIIVLAMVISGIIMQFVRKESLQLDIVKLFAPLMIVTFPTLVFISSLALISDNIKGLNSTAGNIIYFFLWILFVVPAALNFNLLDVSGVSFLLTQIKNACIEAFPGHSAGGMTILGTVDFKGTFEFSGMRATVGLIANRAAVAGLSALMVRWASALFHRFDPFNEDKILFSKNIIDKNTIEEANIMEDTGDAETYPVSDDINDDINNDISDHISGKKRKYSMLFRVKTNIGPLSLTLAEIGIMLKGKKLWWYLVIAFFYITSIFAAIKNTSYYIMPVLLLFSMGVWSSGAGSTRARCTEEYVVSTQLYFPWHYLALYFSRVIPALFIVSGVIINLMIAGMWFNVIYILVGMLFISALWLCLNILTGSNRLFEFLYIILWYTGPFNRTPYLDYTGLTLEKGSYGFIAIYLLLSLVLLSAGFMVKYKNK